MKIIISIFVAMLGVVSGVLYFSHISWHQYKNDKVPFEVMYPPSLIATTTFINFESAYNGALYPVVSIGTRDETYFFVAVSPKSRSIEDVWKYGNGSHIPQRKMILDGRGSVLLKALVGEKPYVLDQDGYDVIMIDDVYEYDITVRHVLGDQILKTFKTVPL